MEDEKKQRIYRTWSIFLKNSRPNKGLIKINRVTGHPGNSTQ